MKKFEIAIGCIFILARILQICNQIPGYAILQFIVLIGLFFLYILYPLFGIKRTGLPMTLAKICVGMSITTYTMGVVFIALHYGTSGWYIFFAGLVYMALVLSALWWKRRKSPSFAKENFIRIGIVLGIGFLSVLLS